MNIVMTVLVLYVIVVIRMLLIHRFRMQRIYSAKMENLLKDKHPDSCDIVLKKYLNISGTTMPMVFQIDKWTYESFYGGNK